jgi:hypothetical protein
MVRLPAIGRHMSTAATDGPITATGRPTSIGTARVAGEAPSPGACTGDWNLGGGTCNVCSCPELPLPFTREHTMPKVALAETEARASALDAIGEKEPLCRCSSLMILSSVARRADGAEVRTYVCGECEHQLHLTRWTQGQQRAMVTTRPPSTPHSRPASGRPARRHRER